MAQYTKNPTIIKTDDGRLIPVDNTNAAYQALLASGEAILPYVPPVTVHDVRNEAERRISAGTTINGVQFKCDDRSTNRLDGMASKFERVEAAGGSWSVTFTTDAGQEITITTAADARALSDAAVEFVALILDKSSALQAMNPIPSDYATNETYWTATP